MHKTFIMFIRIEIRKTRNTDDFLGSGTKLLLPSLSLGFSIRGERETQSFYADCSSIVSSQLTDETNARAHPAVHKLDWPRTGPKNQLASSKSKSQHGLKILPRCLSFRHDMI